MCSFLLQEFMWRYNLGTRKFLLKKLLSRISLLVSHSQETLPDELPVMFLCVNFRIW